jgi:carbon storage regulator
MLVLSRQRDETIMIGDEVEVTVVDIRGDKVRLGITAPKEITVHRKEVYEAIKRENRAAAQVRPEDLDPAAHGGRTISGPKLASGQAERRPEAFDPDKPMVRPTIRASMPQAIRPQKPERNHGRRHEGPAAPREQQSAPPAKPDQGGASDSSEARTAGDSGPDSGT